MISDIIVISNFIVGIFCFLASAFLLVTAINTKKLLFFPFFVYFLFVSISLFLILIYVTNPNISNQLGNILILFSIFITFIADLSLLIMTFFINIKITKRQVISELLITIFLLILLVLLYPSNITYLSSMEPNLSFLYAILLFMSFFVPNFLCIVNLMYVDGTSTVFRGKFKRNLVTFFVLGIILTVGKILSFFSIEINNNSFNFTFMDVLVFLFVIQIFIIVYSIPNYRKTNFSLNYHGN